MGVGPIPAVEKLFKRTGMSVSDIDLFEINEAFSAQVLPSAEKLNIPIEKINVQGGAIAVGHPFGMTGARIMGTLLNNLETNDKQFGLETMCVAGGQGMAIIVERLN
jgi:acetyl-CoA C-acetyltransferase